MTNNRFQQFLLEEMKRRDMSMRQFASMLDLSHGTISGALSEDPPAPSIDFLLRLAKGTNTTFLTVLKLAYPIIEDETVIVDEQLIAERIARLPPDKRAFFDALIDVALKEVEQGAKNS